MSTIYEIAIQAIKPEAAQDYPQARERFLTLLREQPGVEADWTLESFFTMPEPDTQRVLVGITRWRDAEAFSAASEALMPTAQAQEVFAKVDMRAFVQARPLHSASLPLEAFLDDPDRVLEVAVRRLKPGVSEARFAEARAAFFAQIAAQPGHTFDQELVDDQGRRIVLIGWESTAHFMSALGVLSAREEMGAFFELLDVEAYQAARLS